MKLVMTITRHSDLLAAGPQTRHSRILRPGCLYGTERM